MNSPCSIERLQSALAGDLPADEETSLHRHLEECEECGALLEKMAGGGAWCRETASLLVSDELDEAIASHDDGPAGDFAADFAVEHLEPADDPTVLGRLGGYDVLEVLGHGGMGVVLKAFDRDLKRCVAIKTLAPHLAQSSLAKKRFAREAQAAAAVVHPHVLAIHHVQSGGRLPFLVMPLVAGESLAERLATQGLLELKEVLRIGMQAAAGLAAAHEQGLVHRDVKPANILLEKGVERAVLTDFGLARAADDVALTRWGTIAGTPQYMSPEQARGEPLDGRSDLFSLGCVLYEMATGVSPFRTDSVMATLRRLVDESPQPIASLNPELPPWFISIVDRLLEKDPARRFGSAKEVSELLEGCLAHLQQPRTVPLPATLGKSAGWRQAFRRFKVPLAATAALGIGLLVAFFLAAPPPDIAGEWVGDEWGNVVLKKSSDAEYTGEYSDAVGKRPGEIHLAWNRIEGRFNGTWREGDDRFGELSLRLVGDEIRGALTTDSKSKINPATPRLADLKWTRPRAGGRDVAREGEPDAFVGDVVRRGPPSVPRNFSLRFKLASEMADDLRQILLGRPGQESKPSADNQTIVVTAPPEVLNRVQTFITVMDWPDPITRRSNFEYPRDTFLRTARSFFYACAIEDSHEVFSKLLSPAVLAELKGEGDSKQGLAYKIGESPDPEWEKSLRVDWPGKQEAIERLVREWNRYPLKRIREEDGVAIGFGAKYFCTVSFDGAPKDFYSVTIEPERTGDGTGNRSFLFSSLPPWNDFRIAPGVGLRVTIPAMGPAPVALDLAFPVHKAPRDRTQIFNFFVGVQR
ncbi:MAG TPA: protein kinase [Pirellulales bacterium]|nr:protein kinase [Pirellulales bacterium]